MRETAVGKMTKPSVARKKKWNQKKLTPYLFLSPFFIVFAIFMVYPIFESLYLSFTSAQGNQAEWVGFENFKNILTDGLFWKSLIQCIYHFNCSSTGHAHYRNIISCPIKL